MYELRQRVLCMSRAMEENPRGCYEPTNLTKVLFLLLLWQLLHGTSGGLLRPVQGLPLINFSRPGDLNLGVVSTLHRYEQGTLCGNVIGSMLMLQRLESMVFAVEDVNNRSDLLPGVTLGFTILDDCSNELTVATRTLHFIQWPTTSNNPEIPSLPPVDAVAVIGSPVSSYAIQMARLLSVFHVPMLSYASSSSVLDNKDMFSYFSRIVPSDYKQVKAMVDILQTFKWTYVSLLYSDNSYGISAYRDLRRLLKTSGLCLANISMVRNDFTDHDYEDIVHKLVPSERARVVVLFIYQRQMMDLARAVLRLGHQDRFTWLGSDSLSNSVSLFRGLEAVLHGSLVVGFSTSHFPAFEERFRRMTLRDGATDRNPWFGEFFAAAFNCSLTAGSSSSPPCPEDAEIGTSRYYQEELSASLSANAVYAWAHALDAIIRNCSDVSDVRNCVTSEGLRDAVRAVRFTGAGGINISLDETGNGHMSYDVYNLLVTERGGQLQARKVGVWNTAKESFSFLHKDQIQWKAAQLQNVSRSNAQRGDWPASECDQPCPVGHRAVVGHPSCCLHCEKCSQNERVVGVERQQACETCPRGDNFTWPDDQTRTQCLPIPPSFLSITDLSGSLLFVVNLLVFALTCCIIIFYVKHRSERLIKASSRDLSAVMLAGQVLTCVFITTFLLEPSDSACLARTMGFHLSFTLWYGPLLVKTNRVHRIFFLASRTARKPLFISPRAQLLVVAVIVSPQVLVQSVSVAVDPARAVTTMPDPRVRQVNRECVVPLVPFLVSVLLNVLLMTLCAAYAFKTRAVPANFNEARFIMFSLYTTLLLWLTFFPTYFTAASHVVRQLSEATMLLVNTLSGHLFLFLPKVYALYFVAETEMNVKNFFQQRASNKTRSLGASSHDGENDRETGGPGGSSYPW